MGSSRTKSRELALQALFYMDMRQNFSTEALERYCENFALTETGNITEALEALELCSEKFTLSEKMLPFFLELVKGIIPVNSEIDSVIERFSSNWKVSRMSCVDRNVLRISVYEMLFRKDIPPKVSINEAINIGKNFGTEESGAFINGILDSIRIALEKNEIGHLPLKRPGLKQTNR
ncbi:transcription antitermination factor NusB [Desulfonema magnum]|uniref:Transcription antitermination protein NusB n=1 Tax=Desulfonema magnum TaxID=45655 RepID=A0A975GML7_9BACT|nr:transcription antitermination factor NusB [Desulfonema magnum]QTA86790.1 Transcription antitermination protein [Desulfonema magnum]